MSPRRVKTLWPCCNSTGALFGAAFAFAPAGKAGLAVLAACAYNAVSVSAWNALDTYRRVRSRIPCFRGSTASTHTRNLFYPDAGVRFPFFALSFALWHVLNRWPAVFCAVNSCIAALAHISFLSRSAEIVPTMVRTTAIGLMTAAGRFGAIVVRHSGTVVK